MIKKANQRRKQAACRSRAAKYRTQSSHRKHWRKDHGSWSRPPAYGDCIRRSAWSCPKHTPWHAGHQWTARIFGPVNESSTWRHQNPNPNDRRQSKQCIHGPEYDDCAAQCEFAEPQYRSGDAGTVTGGVSLFLICGLLDLKQDFWSVLDV